MIQLILVCVMIGVFVYLIPTLLMLFLLFVLCITEVIYWVWVGLLWPFRLLNQRFKND
jgi:hypothetical protein